MNEESRNELIRGLGILRVTDILCQVKDNPSEEAVGASCGVDRLKTLGAVSVECPARIDFAGGWSDTPPICFDVGGAVINAAIKVNGKRPICCRVKSSTNLNITIVTHSKKESSTLVCERTEQLMDFSSPLEEGALAKACLAVSGISPGKGSEDIPPLSTILNALPCPGGIEIHTWSVLPKGSGLGTSSILASAILAAVWLATGIFEYNSYENLHKDRDFNKSIIHGVLCVEQLLETGGGWQDQVGGIVGGLKSVTCKKNSPFSVSFEELCLGTKSAEDFLKQLNDCLCLVYTGKTRLAKNLLGNVLEGWHTQKQEVVSAINELLRLAKVCKVAFGNCDFMTVGTALREYWNIKREIVSLNSASSCAEPQEVHSLFKSVSKYCCGYSLAGAGGGGFAVLLLNDPVDLKYVEKEIEQINEDIAGQDRMEIYDCEIDRTGMFISAIEPDNIYAFS
eukprot:Nk52_evm47s1992 gene=Nk52_evmTU47s1992